MEYCIAKRENLVNILELYKQLNPTNNDFSLEDANRIWDKIENENIKYFIAKDNDKIIGSCYIIIIPNLTFNGKSIGYIENVITDEKYRRKGIGKKIMEMAINYAKEENCYKVVLQSGIKRTTAHKFYEAIGFNAGTKKAFELRF
ncbi:MAG: GNAT family N-acetyltransferase [Clostridiales bacterium]|jgi:GNAT superfamily N-acetyltransferase|nr:GNAT family N-acetyltransferase [Clostridiales bacterium]